MVYGDTCPPHEDGVVTFRLDRCSCEQLRAIWAIVRPSHVYPTLLQRVAAAQAWAAKERCYLEEARAQLMADEDGER